MAIASQYAQCDIPFDPCGQPDLVLCGRELPRYPLVLVNAIDNCSDSTFFIQAKAQDLYSRYQDSLKGNFESRYLAQCMQAYKYEKFTVTHKVSEYHYTLYYYDQAGNLVKTIAPQGVRPNYDSLWLDSVGLARKAGQVKVPAHVMPTQYRYNTLNQVIAQKSPDGGQTDFWYDRLGRLALSRNARQLAMSNGSNKYYSYTKYDVLGRITEVGQLRDTEGQLVNDTFTRSETLLQGWHNNQLANREQVTNTIYDIPYTGFNGVDPTLVVAQANVRNRVSYVSYTDVPGMTTSYNQASFYSYDIHGNVDTLLQDYGRSDSRPNIMNKNANRWKKIVYEYDLISGKVNKVLYQPRYSDQFTHRYFYDAENRLTEVQTSLDGFTWEREAKYEYYLHGPLARTTLGQQQVQGMDYAYTLQSLSRHGGSWLKGVNSTGATATHDIGADGQVSSLNQYVARDALGFNLNYFHGDFQPINAGVSPFPAYRLPNKGLPDSVYRPLYNGNISSMATSIRKFEALGHAPVLYNYKYDQLNRLVKQDAFFNFNAAANTYYNADSTRWKPDSTFNEQIRYDANGNIQQYKRYAIGPNSRMDDLSYKYYPGTNRLKQVNDIIPDNSYGTNPSNPVVDIDNQVDSNYIYDSIGNLIQDKAEKITNIQWNVYGKITEITRNSLTTDRVTTTRTRYTYDAQGNRISKVTKYYNKDSAKYKLDYTWYVRDAQGNLLSTYTVDKADTSVADLGTLALKQADVQLYGSSRLGNLPPRNSVVDQASNTGPWINPDYRGTTYYRGDRQYEITNHLGNVLTTISDRKIPVYSGSSLNLSGGFTVPVADYFEPDMVSATDYYPFGMVSRGIGPSDKYRFGFNGQEMSNEIKGFGNSYTAEHWEYDPRIGRRWNLDPVYKHSPYEVFGGNPILFADSDGADTINITRTTTRMQFGSMGGGLDGIAPKRTPDKVTRTGSIDITAAEGNDVFRITDVNITIDHNGKETRTTSTTTLNLNNEQTFYRTGGHNMKGYIDDRFALAANVPSWLLNYYAEKSGDIGVKSAIAFQKDVPLAAGLEKITNAAYTVSGIYGVFRFSLSRMAIQSAAKEPSGFVNEAINLTTSSKSTLPSRTYTIYDGSGKLFKFGVTDASLIRYNQSLKLAGPGAYGRYSSIMPKNQAHIMEKYLRSLHYNSTGQYTLPGMKVPYPVDFSTGLPIKP